MAPPRMQWMGQVRELPSPVPQWWAEDWMRSAPFNERYAVLVGYERTSNVSGQNWYQITAVLLRRDVQGMVEVHRTSYGRARDIPGNSNHTAVTPINDRHVMLRFERRQVLSAYPIEARLMGMVLTRTGERLSWGKPIELAPLSNQGLLNIDPSHPLMRDGNRSYVRDTSPFWGFEQAVAVDANTVLLFSMVDHAGATNWEAGAPYYNWTVVRVLRVKNSQLHADRYWQPVTRTKNGTWGGSGGADDFRFINALARVEVGGRSHVFVAYQHSWAWGRSPNCWALMLQYVPSTGRVELLDQKVLPTAQPYEYGSVTSTSPGRAQLTYYDIGSTSKRVHVPVEVSATGLRLRSHFVEQFEGSHYDVGQIAPHRGLPPQSSVAHDIRWSQANLGGPDPPSWALDIVLKEIDFEGAKPAVAAELITQTLNLFGHFAVVIMSPEYGFVVWGYYPVTDPTMRTFTRLFRRKVYRNGIANVGARDIDFNPALQSHERL